MKGNIFTVHAGENLAKEAVLYTLSRVDYKQNPLSLADVTLWVPSPRAGQALKDAFYDVLGSALLPNIRIMSFGEEDLDLYRFESEGLEHAEGVSPLTRLMVLTRLVRAREAGITYREALQKATHLATLFHRLKSHGVALDDVRKVIPPELATHWEKNLDFFKIVFEFYPAWLETEGKIDSADIAEKNLKTQLEILQNQGMKNLTIAVGFSDSTPLGLKLLSELVKHENGALILPFLDLDMKPSAWENLKPTHPNFTMKRMLNLMNLERENVKILGKEKASDVTKMWRYAFNPSEKMERLPDSLALNATAGLTLVEAKSASEEAECVALIMRSVLERKGETCALVTPDRTLAMRVGSALKKFGLNVDDSAGVPLHISPLGRLALLVLKLVNERFSPVLFSEILYHPLVNPKIENFHKLKNELDLWVLRQSSGGFGFAGLKRSLKKAHENKHAQLNDTAPLEGFLKSLEDIFLPLLRGETKLVSAWVSAHLKVVVSLLGGNEAMKKMLESEEGDVFANVLQEWLKESEQIEEMHLENYHQALLVVMEGASVRKRMSTHPRLFIWGPMESRLQSVNHVIVGGVNEGTWPRKVSASPWLSKSVCEKVGLPSPDIHVGMAAHDFFGLVTNGNVYLTRTLKDKEGEMIPSRFLTRLETVLNSEIYKQILAKGDVWKNRVTALRLEGEFKPILPPKPAPSLELRPRIWSASLVRDLMQCPYKAYVSKILKLKALDGYETMPDARDKGDIVHLVLESFFTQVPYMPSPYAGDMEDENTIYEHLLKIAKQAFEQVSEAGVQALWLRKFRTSAQKIASVLVAQHKAGRRVFDVEKAGKHTLTASTSLYAKADRMDKNKNGSLIILDYKTGSPPAKKDVLSGVEPQMAVEAFIASKQGFEGAGDKVSGLEYWQIKGSGKEPVKISHIVSEDDMEIFLENAEEGLVKLATYFEDENTSYEALPMADFSENKKGPCKYCDFSGICRFKDWVGENR